MARLRFSIFTRFVLQNSLYAGLTAVILFASLLTVHVAAHSTAELQNVWGRGADLLSQLDHRLADFRVAELSIPLAPSEDARDEALARAQADAAQIEALQDQYSTLLGPRMPPMFLDFTESWQDYQAAHDAWLRRGAPWPDPELRAGYERAYAAIDTVLRLHVGEAAAKAASVSALAHRADVTLLLTGGLCLLLMARLVMANERGVLRPLRAITRAMSHLAAGNRAAAVPYRERKDEIGEMAAACEVFRLNVLALDAAHEAARVAEEQAQLLARHDALTGLPNRRLFSANLEQALERVRAGKAMYSVMLIDLDEFKKVNDLQGHQSGDVVLCEVARRLEMAVRKTDTVARLGGDEFAIITEGEHDPHEHLEHDKRLAARLLGVIREPIRVGDCLVEIGASIGIASLQAEATDVSTLLRAADIAMYRAKQCGRYTFRFFEQSMDDEMREREALERDLVVALERGEIRPYYQPLVDIGAARIRGFEALARWLHPTRGFVPPDEFIPIIEQLGLTAKLSSTILRHACQDARRWPADICVAVNFSPMELRDEKLAERICRILEEERMAPARLEVEITESALVSDLEAAKTILAALQAKGVTICLDDFGTGYSSLYHLRELRFNKVKIDRSFVQAMLTNPDSEKIIDAILGLTASLHMPAVAEGIETSSALALLREKGCAYGQGYYFGRPLPPEKTAELLTEGVAKKMPIPAI